MSSASEDSPSTWRKPTDIMRLRRKRKSSVNVSLRPQSESSPLSSPNTPTEPLLPPWRKPGQKRRNPFGCSPSKRANNSNRMEGEEHVDSSPLLGILSGTQNEDDKEQIAPAVDQSRVKNIDGILAASIGKEKPANNTSKKEEQIEPAVCREKSCPIDWSLKTRARFVSPKPFSWCTPLRTTDESAGVAAFTHSLPDNVADSVQDASRCENSKREFQKHTLYWQHPNLPWFRLCPRIVPDHKIGKAGSWIINDEIQAALMSDWSGSFNSAFNQLRGGRCPYFYLCAHSFTVLFRAGGVGRRPALHAILSPTSRGLRELLKKEGIEFTMPLAGNFAAKAENMDTKLAKYTSAKDGEGGTPEGSKDSTNTSKEEPSSEPKDDEDDDDITATDDGATSFLETLGLDAARYRSLDPSKIKLQRETFKEIDHRPESMVVVDGSDTQAMFNFLLNCRSCVASSGIQTGIPPTILAPVSFKGASLKCLKYKTGTVRQASAQDGTAPLWHSLEIEGALLPHTLHGLTRLFSHTQGDYRGTFSTHDASAPLNAAPPAEDGEAGDAETAVAGLGETGVQASHIEDIVKECTLGKMVLRDVECKDGLFTWSV